MTPDKNFDTEFGPSETINHLHCPSLRRFEKNWQVKGVWKPHMLIGQAVSEALAVYMKDPTESGLARGLEKANVVLKRGYVEGEEWTLDGLQSLLKKGVEAATETTLAEILTGEKVVGTQLSIGRGRVDLVTTPRVVETSALGDYLIVTDDKTSIQKASRYLNSALEEAELSWQLWDYAWRVQSYYNRPVKYVRIHQLVLTPKPKCYLSDLYPINQENLKQWADAAQLTWEKMGADDLLPYNRLEMDWTWCKNKYGKCPAYDACHVSLRDELSMSNFYDEKKDSV